MIAGDMEIRLRADIARLQRDMDRARQSVSSATAAMGRAADAAKTALAGIASGLGVAQIIQASDQYAKFTAQLRLASNSAREYAAAYGEVKRISTAAQQDLQATGMLYARIANGTRELGTSQKQVAAITETVNMALKVSGATAAESASAQLQLSQAFASGTLRGEEFNAVNEAAPRLMLALADGIGVPVGALKKMAEEGQITSKIMSEVLPLALTQLREEAKQVQTISGAFTVLKNNLMEFTGVTAQSSGVVAVLTSGIGLLANNLGLMLGLAATAGAAKLGAMFAAWTAETYRKVAADQAVRVSTLAAANANLQAAVAASAAATARVAELRTAVLSAEANVGLAITLNGLIPAQTRAAAAAQTHTAALAAQAAAASSASVAGGAARGAMALLGGPIGAVIALLGIAATAWMVWGRSAKESSEMAKESAVDSSNTIIAELDKQIAKNKRIIDLRKEGVSLDKVDKMLRNTNALGALGNEMAAINNGQGPNGERLNSTEQFFARERVMKRIVELQAKINEEERSGAAAAALTQGEARLKFMREYATKQEQMNEKLAEARKLLGQAFTAEDEARIRQHFAAKVSGSTKAKEAAWEETAAYKEAMRSALDKANLRKKEDEEIDEYMRAQQEGYNAAVKGSQDALRAAQAEYDQYGKSKSQIAEITLLTLKSTQAKFNEGSAGYEAATKQIEVQEKLIGVLRAGEARTLGVKAAEDAAAEWKRTAESIQSSLTDALMRGFESGKGFGRNLIDTLKNMFKTLVLRPVISAIVNPVAGALTGALGLSGAAQAAGTSAAGSVAGSVAGGAAAGGLFTGGGLLGSAAAGASWLTTSATLGATLADGAALMGAGTLSGGMAGASMIVGALAPIALGIGAAVAIWKKLDTSGTYHTGGGATASKGGVTTTAAESLGFAATRTNAETEKMVSGLAQGIVSILDSTATAFGKTAGYTAATAFADDSSKDGAWGGLLIKKMGETVLDSNSNRSSRWAPKEFGDGKQGQEQYLAALSASVRTALDGIGMPAWAQKMLDGLGGSASLEDMAKVVDAINMTQTALVQMGDKLVGFSSLSEAAVSALIAASGGIEALAGSASAYYDNFYTESEKLAESQKQLTDAITAAGIAMPTTRDEYRAQVEAQMALGEAGASTVAVLLKNAAAFAQLHPAVEKIAESVSAVADQVSADAARMAADAARYPAYTRAVIEQAQATSAYQVQIESIGNAFLVGTQRATAAAKALRAYNDALTTGANSPLSGKSRFALAKEQFQNADGSNLQGAASAFIEAAKAGATNRIDYARAFGMVQTRLNAEIGNQEASVTGIARLWRWMQEDRLDGSHRAGLDNVPFDGYRAELHRGEKVLTSSEANSYRSGGGDAALRENSSLLREVLTELRSGNKDIRTSTNILERVSRGGTSIRTEPA